MVEENIKLPKVENEVVKKPTASELPRRTPTQALFRPDNAKLP